MEIEVEKVIALESNNYRRDNVTREIARYILEQGLIKKTCRFPCYSKNLIISYASSFFSKIGIQDYFSSLLEQKRIIFCEYNTVNNNLLKYRIKKSGCYYIDGLKVVVAYLKKDLYDIYILIEQVLKCYLQDEATICDSKVISTVGLMSQYYLDDYFCDHSVDKYQLAQVERCRAAFYAAANYEIISSEIEYYIQHHELNIDDLMYKTSFKKYYLFHKNIIQNSDYLTACGCLDLQRNAAIIIASILAPYFKENNSISDFPVFISNAYESTLEQLFQINGLNNFEYHSFKHCKILENYHDIVKKNKGDL